jgi:hypothetical protein
MAGPSAAMELIEVPTPTHHEGFAVITQEIFLSQQNSNGISLE